ncbi:MAG: pilus assembly protein PilM [Candidatus Atribacteria bacterium]|nr:pilus assembly protein PilM [Candidatus Atribacteria bacterium]
MLGVDLGIYSLKFFQTKKKREDLFDVIRTGDLVIPGDVFMEGDIKGKNVLAENLKLFWKKNKLPREASVSFYHPRMVVQNISIPQMSDMELENALKWEASSIMTGEENFQIGWQILGKTDDKLDILYAASPSLVVADYLDVFKKAGIRVDAIEPQILSLLKGFLALNPSLSREGSFVLTDIGFSKVTIVYFEKGKLMYSRYFGWGVKKIWDYLKEKHKMLPAETQELLNRSTQSSDLPYQLEEALNETTGALLSEFRRSFTFFQSEFGSTAVMNCFLVGGGATILSLKTILSIGLNITFQELKPILLNRNKPLQPERFLAALGASLWN